MKDGMFVFDNVVHMFDNRESNMGPNGHHTAGNLAGFGKVFSNSEYPTWEKFLGEAMSVEDAGRILFEESDTDMAVAQTVPLFGWWKDGFSPAHRNFLLKEAYPDRVVFCGAFREKPGMPGDFARFMSKKVLELKAPPEIFRRIWFTTMELE